MGLLLLSSSASAEVYRYVDENGVVLLTDVPRGSDVLSARNVRAAETHRTRYQQIIARKADKYDLDPRLISAIVRTESNFNSRAVSRRGAIGLMQLMPETAREMGVRNPYNPEQNIEGGTRYLKHLLMKYGGDLTRALAAYNAGPGKIERNIMPRETKQYIKKVYSVYNGKRRIAVSPRSSRTVIYKAVGKDGRVFFTNYMPGRVASPGF